MQSTNNAAMQPPQFNPLPTTAMLQHSASTTDVLGTVVCSHSHTGMFTSNQ